MKNLHIFKILEFFIRNPYQRVYLRELAKKLKLSPFTTKRYVDVLVREKFIYEEREAKMRYFKANLSNIAFRYIKIAYSLHEILKSGLISFLLTNIPNISSIVLFGSIAKGEDSEKSDVDLLIIGKPKYIRVGKFEERLKRDIALHIFSWSEWNKKAKEDKAFYLEIIRYGVPIYGELPMIE
ncbi:MAG: hypothetical protein DRP03_00510 [Candidatus Aenigmatarchaeota archaeon]|nr:MAG: hypothetical protein DRP03_00510 [Candidatus Aenigmarchaeota archaeon]